MEFIPLYYTDKVRQVDVQNPSFEKESINVINPGGRAGIVTLWSKPREVWNALMQKSPALFTRDSPVVTLTSLYGNGLPQMLVNLANNPQIEYLAVTGNDTQVVPSFNFLMNFLERGIELPQEEGQLGKIRGTEFAIDPQLTPQLFSHLKVRRFPLSDLESLLPFVSQPLSSAKKESDRVRVKLIEPVFSDFPSDVMRHAVYAETPLQAWVEVMYHLDRFGKNVWLKKGARRTLYNLPVIVENPAPESPELLRTFGFDPAALAVYREDMLKKDPPEGMSYSYGNRLRAYFGVDTLEKVIERFNNDRVDRRGFITLWDNTQDIISPKESDSSVPCLTNLYFVNMDAQLTLTADFRTHAATSAWLLNLYGLRAIQEYVSNKTGINPGRIEMFSRWISIDPNDGKTNAALDLVKKHRKTNLDVHDPRGYLVVEARGGNIVAEHYGHQHQKLKTYHGKTAKELKDQLRQDAAIANPDHAMWIGYELARAHQKLYGELPEL